MREIRLLYLKKSLAIFLLCCIIFQFLIFSGRWKTLGQVDIFLLVCSRWNVSIVLIDRNGLEYYQKVRSDKEKNIFATKPLWTLATWDGERLQKDEILQELRGFGFESTILHDTNSSRPIALISRSNLHIIHIVLFHDRKGNFWWHGSLDLDYSLEEKLRIIGVQRSQLNAMKNAGAFDKFDTERIDINLQALLIPRNIKKFLQQLKQSRFLECDMETANSFVQKYGRDKSDDVQEFVNKSRNSIFTAKGILDRLEVPFWLQSGTLLGYLRECGIISYTTDVDIGFYAKDYKPGVLLDFESSGFSVVFVDGRVNDSFVLSLKRDGVKLDLFAFYEGENNTWMGHSSSSGDKFRYIYPKITLCWTEFLELKVRVPCNVREVIEVEYGKDWFTPNKDWNYLTSSQNSMQEGQWPDDQNPHETYKSYLEVLRKQGQ